ncbi:MAG: PfkB family carbohydrate kinase [Acidimicrobiia bacterium]|nr:PfkB family carbohydrate kinase [Acidimicrobiia bacterium]
MLCCVGDLVEDVVVWPQATLRRGTDTPARVFRRRGGSAANVAVLAALTGAPSRFIGQIGADRLGDLLLGELEDAGVDAAVIRSGNTGTVVVLVEPSGERNMLPDRAAAVELADVPAGALDDATWLHVPGYSLIVEPLGSTARRLIAGARDLGAGISIDASSVGLLAEFGIAAFLTQIEELRPDLLFCNKDEADLLEVQPGSNPAGVTLSVVKAGPRPVQLIGQHTATWVPVPPVPDVADTTGAGDAFAAGFLVESMRGADPVTAAAAGNELAATVLRRPGAGTHDR